MEEEIVQNIETTENGYVIFNGKFNYGTRTKNYGLFNLMLDINSNRIINLDVVLGSKNDIKNIELKFNEKLFKETIEKVDQTAIHEAKKIELGLKDTLDVAEILEVLNFIKDDNQVEVKSILKEKLENIVREEMNLDIYTKALTSGQLKDSYPELFSEKIMDSLEEGDEANQTNNEEEKLGARIKIKCKPIVSPVKGKRITELRVNDRLIVIIDDTREIGKELKEMLQDSEGAIVGVIEEKNFNQELNNYSVLIKFRDEIYGSLIVGPEVKLKSFFSADRQEEKEFELEDKNISSNNLLLFGLIVLIIILVVVIIGIYL